ncbi:hypothetical protein RFI_04859, partial [Reticulomyxa filosa]
IEHFYKKMMIFLFGCFASFSERKKVKYGVRPPVSARSKKAATRLSKKKKNCVRPNPHSLQRKTSGLKPLRIGKKIKEFVSFIFFILYFLFIKQLVQESKNGLESVFIFIFIFYLCLTRLILNIWGEKKIKWEKIKKWGIKFKKWGGKIFYLRKMEKNKKIKKMKKEKKEKKKIGRAKRSANENGATLWYRDGGIDWTDRRSENNEEEGKSLLVNVKSRIIQCASG